MNSLQRKKILLSYCLYPDSVASHIDRVLRKRHDVRTWGPCANKQILKFLKMESIPGPAIDPDIPFDTTDPADALALHAPGWEPDVYLWIESGVQFGIDLSRLHCLKACYLLNTHISLPDDRRVTSHLQWARHFSIAFLAHQQYVKRFQNSGINAYWLPVAETPEHNEERVSMIEKVLFEAPDV
jgi:hypothetical protein